MPSCKDVTIQLRVDDTAQEEYGVNTLGDGSVECHIASQEDKASVWKGCSHGLAEGLLDVSTSCKEQPTRQSPILQGVRGRSANGQAGLLTEENSV